MNKISVDYLVIGGGIFGSYAAKYLASNASVLLVEREASLLAGASKSNQTRLHAGFHYLRAPRTAIEANLYHDRFLRDHEFAINKNFRHFYGIARQGSLTDSKGFERFCEWLSLAVEKQENSDIFEKNRISDTYLVDEFSFDPFLISKFYHNELKNLNVKLHLSSEIISAKSIADSWQIEIKNTNGELSLIEAKCVINATYSNLNSVTRLFKLPESRMKHEYSELLLVYVPTLKDTAITVMDGPYFSITPYGLTGLHVLSSVIYTHHSSTINSGPKMSCQIANGFCEVDRFNPCQTCPDKPESAQKFMLNQLRTYIPNIGHIYIHGEIETVKSTWAMEDYRDERKTSILKLGSGPDFYTVMSGKVSSIYEMESMFNAN